MAKSRERLLAREMRRRGLSIREIAKKIKSKWVKEYEFRSTYYGVLAAHVQRSTDLSYRIDGAIDHLREIADFRDRIGELAG